jgi:hypothetical protein
LFYLYLCPSSQTFKIMKKYILPIALSGVMLLSACGPSAEEKAAEEKRKQDSIAEAERLAAEAAMKAEQQRIQDSIAAVIEQMRQDSIKMAEQMAKMKKGSAPKPKPAPPKEEPKGTGITKGGVEIKSDGKPASTEPPKVTKGGQPIGGGK